uniref:Uncharacterized protein n=1 Tax=Setaria digitata TaxID=48799 RepID=A0A915Q306_9BILA
MFDSNGLGVCFNGCNRPTAFITGSFGASDIISSWSWPDDIDGGPSSRVVESEKPVFAERLMNSQHFN